MLLKYKHEVYSGRLEGSAANVRAGCTAVFMCAAVPSTCSGVPCARARSGSPHLLHTHLEETRDEGLNGLPHEGVVEQAGLVRPQERVAARIRPLRGNSAPVNLPISTRVFVRAVRVCAVSV